MHEHEPSCTPDVHVNRHCATRIRKRTRAGPHQPGPRLRHALLERATGARAHSPSVSLDLRCYSYIYGERRQQPGRGPPGLAEGDAPGESLQG